MEPQLTQAEQIADGIIGRYYKKLMWELDVQLEDSIVEELATHVNDPLSHNCKLKHDDNWEFWSDARIEALGPVLHAVEQALPQAKSNLAAHVDAIFSGTSDIEQPKAHVH